MKRFNKITEQEAGQMARGHEAGRTAYVKDSTPEHTVMPTDPATFTEENVGEGYYFVRGYVAGYRRAARGLPRWNPFAPTS